MGVVNGQVWGMFQRLKCLQGRPHSNGYLIPVVCIYLRWCAFVLEPVKLASLLYAKFTIRTIFAADVNLVDGSINVLFVFMARQP